MNAMQVNNAKAVGEAAREPDMAVVVGAWVFFNADHTHTLEKAEQVLCDAQFTYRCERRWVDRLELIQHRG